MSLPELEWQILYGRLGWAIVLTALATAVWPRSWQLSRGTVALLLICAVGLQVLPGEASLTYWIGLAFQMPSGFLVGLCLVRLYSAWQNRPATAAMTPALAAPIVLVGGGLYLDAIGVLSQGYYYWGFGREGAPLLALFIAVACAATAIFGHARPQSLALLAGMTLFAVLRLPTGNFWDALLDPILWGWALVSLATTCRRWRSGLPQRHSSLGKHL